MSLWYVGYLGLEPTEHMKVRLLVGWLDFSLHTSSSLPGLELVSNRPWLSCVPTLALQEDSFGGAGLEGWVSQFISSDPWMVFSCLDEPSRRKKGADHGKVVRTSLDEPITQTFPLWLCQVPLSRTLTHTVRSLILGSCLPHMAFLLWEAFRHITLNLFIRSHFFAMLDICF